MNQEQDLINFKKLSLSGIGIYIHIPFCTKACHYCNFYFVTSLTKRAEFIEALIQEIKHRAAFFKDNSVQTIYFGGGTPSLLESTEIDKILNTIYQYYDTKNLIEVTIEANPDDLIESKIIDLKQAGFNRLSIGIQSFIEEDLKRMNRSHSVEQAHKALNLVKKYFDNYSIDLIFGLPEMTLEKWKYNLNQVLFYNVPHISTYNLTIEEKTALERLIKNKKVAVTSESINADLYSYTLEFLELHGYINYEISNFGKKDFFALHNTSYWLDIAYLGFGPSAHSYINNTRQWNISNLNSYIKNIKNNEIWYENELLTTNNRYNEYVLTKLRTIFGINSEEITIKFGDSYAVHLKKHIQKYIQQGLIINKNSTYKLTNQGKLLADVLSSDLMIVE